MPTFTTRAGARLAEILASQPLHLMYEESKRGHDGLNLNPALRAELGGQALRYPTNPNWTCDVVFTLGNDRIWLESKLAQSHNGGNEPRWQSQFGQRNPNFEKHLGLGPDPRHSALNDVRDRLPTLAVGDATHIGFLMVLYDKARFRGDTVATIDKFVRMGNLGAWARDTLLDAHDPRPMAMREGATIQVFYWEREVGPAGAQQPAPP